MLAYLRGGANLEVDQRGLLPCSNTTGIVPVRPTAAAPFLPTPPSVSASVFRLDQSFITLEGARCETSACAGIERGTSVST